ncbi:SDR family NAD(P)-dependent oxidoreductase [Agromyces albus]|uniref:SDR family NAD(P)-dependent oxidoreductase n=1 Tax=Agromyces albus TaxID=205332 RepID=UPI002783683D|nr:SDR family NAD(P)-dependent oxidoreductase [Agromyces albus]MDQ0577690.1 NAD(P)-dependent dehydrogenase (short-subunit alcohol dehydrogenase family) [Agromyces albus]
MTDRLTGKTALVTGAASGIGRQVALRFLGEGARVVFADRDEAALATVVAGLGEGADGGGAAGGAGAARGVVMDISDEASVEAAMALLAADGWSPNVVVANAGVQLFGHDAKAGDLDLEVWRRTIDVNLTGTFLTVKHAVRAMLARDGGGGGGSIILTGSPTGVRGEGDVFTAYSTSKAGIHGLGRTVAAAYARDGIRVNTVIPAYTETPLVSTLTGDDDARTAIVSRIPMGRAGSAADVEGIMVYLASDESAFATGAAFAVDGGMSSL